jgi:uncharacterized protein YqeY
MHGMTPAEELKTSLREDLRAAMRSGRRDAVALMRALIAAIDNAEAVPVDVDANRSQLRSFAAGRAEATRKILDGAELAELLAAEALSRRNAARAYRAGGEGARADALEREALLVEEYRAR